MPALNARVQILETVDRQEQFDADGGGRIVRILYCEPYTAHKRVVTALKGTVVSSNVNTPTDPAATWFRKLPHADPLYPWFYASDVQVVPFNKTAVRGSPSKGFVNNPGLDDVQLGQFFAIQSALNTVDDFDGASFIDNLTPAEISDGGAQYGAAADVTLTNTGESFPVSSYTSRGQCGAFLIATYYPLLFMPGITSSFSASTAGGQQFDFVDPQWEPLTIKSQVGRSLQFYSPQFGIAGQNPVLHGGLTDTYELPEMVWRFTIRRLMVPWLPKTTLNLFTNKINNGLVYLGNLAFPAGTLRMDTPEVITRRGPDGNMWFDILLKFMVRMLWDEYFDANGNVAKGWIDWNHQFGIPTASIHEVGFLMNQRGGYYPVAWNGGLFQYWGVNHPLYLSDQNVDLTQISNNTGLLGTLVNAPFQAGFMQNQ